MKRRTLWMAGPLAVVVLLMAAVNAFGYTGQTPGAGTLSVGDPCGASFTVTATFVDVNGTPLSGESVAWSLATTPSASDQIHKTPTITDSHGVATTTVSLAPVAGTRQIRATVGEVSATAVANPVCGGVLPNTSTLAAETPGRGAPLAAMLLVVLAFAVAGWLTLRRIAPARP